MQVAQFKTHVIDQTFPALTQGLLRCESVSDCQEWKRALQFQVASLPLTGESQPQEEDFFAVFVRKMTWV